jgi:hypothetical protein
MIRDAPFTTLPLHNVAGLRHPDHPDLESRGESDRQAGTRDRGSHFHHISCFVGTIQLHGSEFDRGGRTRVD